MTSGKNARADRQAKIAAATPEQNKTKVILGTVVALVAIIGIVAAIFVGTRGSDEATGGDDSSGTATSIPKGATSDTSGITVNADTAKPDAPSIDVYEDFQCPGCASAANLLAPSLKEMANAGDIKLTFHMKTFLDDNLQNDSSKKVANAAACAADDGKFLEYHTAAFAGHPTNEGTGYTDAQVQEFAKTAGITGAALTTWQQCVTDKKYEGYVAKVEDASSRDGITSTPTYRRNGEKLDLGKLQTQGDIKPLFTTGQVPGASASPNQ